MKLEEQLQVMEDNTDPIPIWLGVLIVLLQIVLPLIVLFTPTQRYK